jgi:threonyl-tRNA synthetase
MVNITFPDSSKKIFENNPTGFDVAKSISEGFARNCVAMEIDGEPADLEQ